jgi:Esterase/lipase
VVPESPSWVRCDTASYTTRPFCKKTKQGDRIFRKSAERKKREYKKVAKEYLGRVWRFGDEIANPFNSKQNELRSFPETCVMVGDEDSIRDDGLIMAGKLQAEGVKCYASVYDGMWHDWMLYSQKSCPKAGRAAYKQVENFVLGRTLECSVQQEVLPSTDVSVVLST